MMLSEPDDPIGFCEDCGEYARLAIKFVFKWVPEDPSAVDELVSSDFLNDKYQDSEINMCVKCVMSYVQDLSGIVSDIMHEVPNSAQVVDTVEPETEVFPTKEEVTGAKFLTMAYLSISNKPVNPVFDIPKGKTGKENK